MNRTKSSLLASSLRNMATHTTQTLSYFSASEKRIQMKHILFSFPETKLYDREYTIKIYAVDST